MRIGFRGKLKDEPEIRAGFIGCGSHDIRNLYPAPQCAPVNLVAVCDFDIRKARAFAGAFGAKSAYCDHLCLTKISPAMQSRAKAKKETRMGAFGLGYFLAGSFKGLPPRMEFLFYLLVHGHCLVHRPLPCMTDTYPRLKKHEVGSSHAVTYAQVVVT